MKPLISSLLFAGVALWAVSCGNNDSKEPKVTEETPTTPVAGAGSSVGEVAIRNDELNAIYTHYVHLSTALTEGNLAEAKVASNAIEAGARQMQGGNKIAVAAASITHADNLKKQRAAYSALSNELIALVKKSGMNSGAVYVDYCPMAFNDKGAYWLSSDKEIRNPYFGDEMLTCGEVKETIQ